MAKKKTEEVIEEINDRFNDYKNTQHHLENINILVIEKTSGSDIVSIIYHSYKELYSNIKVLKGNDSDIIDKERICPKNWYKFGNYGEYIYSKGIKRLEENLDSDSLIIDIYDDNNELYNHKCLLQ